jgi:hypothetical protein
MASSSGLVLVSKEIREQLRDESDSINELVWIQTVMYLTVLTLMPTYVDLI